MERDRRRQMRLILTGAAVALLAWFALANTESVPVHVWVHAAHLPMIEVIAVSGVLGAGVALLASRSAGRRGKTDK